MRYHHSATFNIYEPNRRYLQLNIWKSIATRISRRGTPTSFAVVILALERVSMMLGRMRTVASRGHRGSCCALVNRRFPSSQVEDGAQTVSNFRPTPLLGMFTIAVFISLEFVGTTRCCCCGGCSGSIAIVVTIHIERIIWTIGIYFFFRLVK